MSINLKALTINQPRANIEDYIFTLYGRAKSGKTSLFAKLMKKIYGDVSKGLLIGFEKGYQALQVVAQDINSWEDFIEVTDQLIEYKNELDIKFLGLDTIDWAYKYACEYVIKQRRIEDKKPYKVIGDIPYGNGYELVITEMSKRFSMLQKAGYGLMFITHDTEKKFESRDGVSYDKTTCSLPTRARDLIVNMSDFILFIDIAKEKDGDKLVDARYIYFRADGADLEAGSRFANVPNRIPYDVDLFVETFENAVLNSFDEDVDIEEVKQEQAKEREQETSRWLEENKDDDMSAEELISKIDLVIAEMNVDKEKRKILANIFREETGAANYKNCTDVDKLKSCIARLKKL